MNGLRRRAVVVAIALLGGIATPAATGAAPEAPGQAPPVDVRALGRPLETWNDSQYMVRVTERGQVLLPARLDDGTVATAVWTRGRIQTLPGQPDLANWPLTPRDISNRGQVLGHYIGRTPCMDSPFAPVLLCPVAVSWADGRLTHLPTTSGFAHAYNVNDRGQITGRLAVPDEAGRFTQWQEVAWDDGEIVPLPDPGNISIEGRHGDHLNDRGQVLVGIDGGDGWEWRAGIWQIGGGITDLGRHGVRSDAHAINERGRVALTSLPFFGTNVPDNVLLWRNGRVVDLGAFRVREVVALNERDQVLLDAWTDEGVGAYIVDEGGVIDLGVLDTWTSTEDGGQIADMNDRAQVVGSKRDAGSRRAVLWHDGGWIDLPHPAGAEDESSFATDINNRGQIVGVVGTTPVMWSLRDDRSPG